MRRSTKIGSLALGLLTACLGACDVAGLPAALGATSNEPAGDVRSANCASDDARARTPGESGVDWDVRLRADVRTMFVLMTTTAGLDAATVAQHGEAVEALSTRINEYPDERREYLRGFGDTYLRYSRAYLDDLLSSIDESLERPGELTVMTSDRTEALEEELLGYAGARHVVTEHALGVQMLGETLHQRTPTQLSPEERAAVLSALELSMHETQSKMEATYEMIFGELM